MGVKKQWSDRFKRDVWGYDARIGGVRRQAFGFATPDAAQVALSKARINAFERRQGVAPPAERPTVTVKALVERRVAQLQATPRRQVSAGQLTRWLSTLPAGLLATELTTAHLREWADMRLRSVKPQSVFRELTDICSCLTSARENFAALEDWTPPRRPRMRVPTGRRERLISAEEARAVLAALRRPQEAGETARYWRVRQDSADLFQIALLTAARRMEILSLRWSDVNFDWRTLRITGTKTERVRLVEMGAPLMALLLRRQGTSEASALVFPVMAARQCSGPGQYRPNLPQGVRSHRHPVRARCARRLCAPRRAPYGDHGDASCR